MDQDDDNFALSLELEEALIEASDGIGKSFFELPASDDFASIPQDPLNPLTKDKVALGKLLFHETGLGIHPKLDLGKETYSCASCHFASAGFQACRQQGIGEGGIGFGLNGQHRSIGSLYDGETIDVQAIRTPTAMNGAFQEAMLWNGQFGAKGINEGTEASWTEGTPKEKNNLGFEGLETQAIAGLEVHRLGLNDEILNGLNYKEYFDKAFSDQAEDERENLINAGLAIAAYERTLLANEAPFQRWLKGDTDAMSNLEIQGAILFFTKAACVQCHTGPALNKMDFAAIGMKDLVDHPEETINTNLENIENKGRGGFTANSEDDYKFKIPQLYNLKDSPFYGHGASMSSIQEIVDYKNNGIAENPRVPVAQLSEHFKPLNLDEDEIQAISHFLGNSLRDPNLDRYTPDHVLSGNCIPVNDVLSSAQIGCK